MFIGGKQYFFRFSKITEAILKSRGAEQKDLFKP